MGQVLKTLVDQTTTKAYSYHRSILIHKIELAQVYEFSQNFDQALCIYDSVLKEISPAIDEIHAELKKETNIRIELKKVPDIDLTQKQTLKDNQERIMVLKARLDIWLELKHRTFFFIGASYHSMASYSDETLIPKYPEFTKKEEIYYKYAASIRREILGVDEGNIKALNEKIYSFSDVIASEASGPGNELLIYLPLDKYVGGLRCGSLFGKLRDVSENLNNQWELLDEWRFSIIDLVTKPLEDAQDSEGGENAHAGDEYAEGLDNQEKLATLVYCYRRLLYDRAVLLTGVRNERGERDSNTSQNLISGRYANSTFKNDHHFEPLDSKRLSFSPDKDERGLRGWISDMQILSKGTDVPAIESQMCTFAHKEFSHCYELQQKIMRKLEIEMDNISDLLEHRRDYYIRLQKLSDGVIPLDRSDNIERLENNIKESLNSCQISYSSTVGRKRYLEHLLNEEQSDGSIEMDLECGICRSTMEQRAILHCGHYFCNKCATAWLTRHQKCPTCNQVMHLFYVIESIYFRFNHIFTISTSKKHNSLQKRRRV